MNSSESQSGQASSSSLSPKVNGNGLIQHYLDTSYQEALERIEDKETRKELKIALKTVEKRLRKIQSCFEEPSTYRQTLLSQKNDIKNTIKSQINFVQASANNVTDKMMAIDVLMKRSEMLFPIFKGIDKPVSMEQGTNEKDYRHLIAEQALLLADNEADRFQQFLEELRTEHLTDQAVVGQCFISYAWPSEKHKEQEKWIQPFLGKLRDALRAAGIPAEVDKIDNQGGENIYHYMDRVQESDVVLVIGTESLLEKHQQGTTAVCNELILINRARAKGNARVIPILLSGDYETSFPAYFAMYNTVIDWREKSYLHNLQELIRTLCDIGQDAKEYKALWQGYFQTVLLLEKGLNDQQTEDYFSAFAESQRMEQQQHSAIFQGMLRRIVSPVTASPNALPRLLARLEEYAKKEAREAELPQLESLYVDLDAQKSAHKHATRENLQTVIDQFLGGRERVCTLLGDAGAGKTTFSLMLQQRLWQQRSSEAKGFIPIRLELKTFTKETAAFGVNHVLINVYHFNESEVQEMRDSEEAFLFIFDGYDELAGGGYPNLYESNQLKYFGRDSKVLISCRPEYVASQNHSSIFAPDVEGTLQPLWVGWYVSALSELQVESYISKRLTDTSSPFTLEDTLSFMKGHAGLSELLNTPFLLNIYLGAYSQLKDQAIEKAIARGDLYQAFIKAWFKKEEKKFDIIFGKVEGDIKQAFWGFSMALAFEMFEARINAVEYKPLVKNRFAQQVQSKIDYQRWERFFTNKEEEVVQARRGCPLRHVGDTYSFIHQSFLEYFIAEKFWLALEQGDETELQRVWNARCLTLEPKMPVVLQFLFERLAYYLNTVRGEAAETYQIRLWELVELSKAKEEVGTAAANAITVLNYAGVDFNQKDLQGIRIVGADLNGVSFDYANLSGADLRQVNLRNAFLRGANLGGAQMTGTNFGLWPSLKHIASARCLSYSQDGRWLATGEGGSCEIYLWDLETLSIKHRLRRHSDQITSLCFRGDSQQLASGSKDKTVKLWEVSTGRMEKNLVGHTDEVTSVSYRGDGQQLASCSKDKTVKLWEVSTGRMEKNLVGHTDKVTSVSYRGDGQQLASGSMDTTVRLWAVSTGHMEKSLGGHTGGGVACVSYRSDGQQLASGNYDTTIKLWDVSSGRLEKSLEGHGDSVTSVCYRGDSQQLASGSYDRTIKLWDVETGRLERDLEGHKNWIFCVGYRRDGQQLASGSLDGTLKLWEVTTGCLERNPEGHTTWVTSVSYRGDGQQLASGSMDRTVKLWEASSGRLAMNLKGHTNGVISVSYQEGGQQLASGSQDRSVRLWEMATGSTKRSLEHALGVKCVSYRGDGLQLASNGSDESVNLWDVATGRLERRLEGHRQSVTCLSYRDDGQQLASGSYDNTVKLWQVATGQLEKSLEGHTRTVWSVSYRSDSQQLASGSFDNTIMLWELATGRLESTLTGHTSYVKSVSYRKDCKQLASGSDDSTIRIWNPDTYECLHIIRGHLNNVESVCFSLNGSLASGSKDGTVKVWREQEIKGKKIMTLHWSRGPYAFFADGCQIRNVQGLAPLERSMLIEHGATERVDEMEAKSTNPK